MTNDSGGPPVRNLEGVLWMLAAMVTITTMFAILKHVTQDLPVLVAASFRTGVSFLLLLPWLLRGGRAVIATNRLGGHFLRALFGMAGFACMTYAIAHMLLADATLLTFTMPFWTILITAALGREKIRKHRALATLVGFVGVLVVVRPQGGLAPAALVAIAGAVMGSLAMITMKDLTRTEPPARIVFYLFLFGTLILLPGAILTWQTPTTSQYLWMCGAGALAALGQSFLARAYHRAEVGVVAPFDFTRLPIAATIGYLAFAEVPDVWTWVGTAVILSSVIFISYRERVLRRGLQL